MTRKHLQLTKLCSHDNSPLLLQLSRHMFYATSSAPHSKARIRIPTLQMEKPRPREEKPLSLPAQEWVALLPSPLPAPGVTAVPSCRMYCKATCGSANVWFAFPGSPTRGLCVHPADTRRPQGSTLPHLVGGAENRGPHCQGRQQRLSAKQGIGEAVRQAWGR